MPNPFTAGVVVFFRAFGRDGDTLARSVHPDGRGVEINSEFQPDDYIVIDEAGATIGIYPRDWVAAILPLQTTGPAHASDQQTRRDSAPAAAEGDPSNISERVKRFDS